MTLTKVKEVTKESALGLKSFAQINGSPDQKIFSDPDFDWQFMQPSQMVGDGVSGCWALYQDDNCVGLSLGARTPFWINGNVKIGLWHQSWYGSPDFPTSGFELVTRQMGLNSVISSIGQSIESANVLQTLRPNSWFETRRLFKVIDSSATMELMIDKSNGVRNFLKLHSKRIKNASSGSCQKITIFDDEYNNTWDHFRKSISFSTNRTKEYMNWRYANHPIFQYCMVKVETIEGVVYYVWREETVGDLSIKVGRICEVIGSSPAAIKKSFPLVYPIWKEQGLAFVDFYCTHGATVGNLYEVGMQVVVPVPDFDLPRLFAPLDIEFRKTLNVQIVANKDNAGSWLYHPEKFYITKGDANQDRPT